MLFITQIQGPVPVGTNIANGKTWIKTEYPRKITRIALVGGTNIGDAELTVGYGSLKQFILKNFNTNNRVHSDDCFWNTSQVILPANTPLIVEVSKALQSTGYTLILEAVKA